MTENINSTKDYYLAAAASRVVLQPAGAVVLNGVAMGQLFFKRALDSAGVLPEFEQRHEYKNAPDGFLREGYSDPHREAATALATGLAEEVVDAVGIAVGETVILLHPTLPLAGVSIAMERERQQNDSLANG